MDKPLKTLRRTSGFSGANAEYIDQLYEAFSDDPESVSPEWRSFFYGFEQGAADGEPTADRTRAPLTPEDRTDTLSGIERLILAYRLLGHLYADIDPLGLMPRKHPRELDPSYYGLDEEALQHPVNVVAIDAEKPLPAREVDDALVEQQALDQPTEQRVRERVAHPGERPLGGLDPFARPPTNEGAERPASGVADVVGGGDEPIPPPVQDLASLCG